MCARGIEMCASCHCLPHLFSYLRLSLRGYYGFSMMNSWYGSPEQKYIMHEWENVNLDTYAKEWPDAWIGESTIHSYYLKTMDTLTSPHLFVRSVGIDGDVQPSRDKF